MVRHEKLNFPQQTGRVVPLRKAIYVTAADVNGRKLTDIPELTNPGEIYDYVITMVNTVSYSEKVTLFESMSRAAISHNSTAI